MGRKRNISSKREKYIMKKYLRNILYGFLAWFIPFAASFFFYTRFTKIGIICLAFPR
jgi:hypothetical protein